jgi:hypothetical protein
MTATRRFAILVLACAGLAGCGTVDTSRENWAYTGRDAALRQPAPPSIGELASAAWALEAQGKLDAWQRRTQAAVNADKEACGRETGQGGAPGARSGNGDAFLACMKARGWIRTSNPL